MGYNSTRRREIKGGTICKFTLRKRSVLISNIILYYVFIFTNFSCLLIFSSLFLYFFFIPNNILPMWIKAGKTCLLFLPSGISFYRQNSITNHNEGSTAQETNYPPGWAVYSYTGIYITTRYSCALTLTKTRHNHYFWCVPKTVPPLRSVHTPWSLAVHLHKP